MSKEFKKPTAKEVEDYSKTIDFYINGEEFVNYYESKGWTVGPRTPMKDWKAAVRYWKSRRPKENRKAVAPPRRRVALTANDLIESIERQHRQPEG